MKTGSLRVSALLASLWLGCGSSGSRGLPDAGPGTDGAAQDAPGAHDGAEGDGPLADGPAPDGASSPDGPVPSNAITITVEPDGSKDASGLLDAINGAKAAVHVEMYLLTNTTYEDALINLHKAGKDVKVVLNQTFPSGTSASDTNADSYSKLKAAGVDVVWAPTNTGFDSYTHAKAVIIDPGAATGAQVWIMTMNLDYAGPESNREFLAEDTGPADVAEAEAIFEADFADKPITPSGALVVAPSPQNNAVSVLVDLINSATETIDLEAEELDDSGSEEVLVFNALVAKARAGVVVHVVLEDSSDSEQTTAVNALVAAGGKVVGYSCSGKVLDIHAKALVADSARAYVGSENFSGSSLGYNRELGVYFTEPAPVAKVTSTITGDFAAGSPYSSTCSF